MILLKGERMKKKKLIPLLLLLLLLLIIMCVWTHGENIVKNRATRSPAVTLPVVEKDIDFCFTKKDNRIELTGNFSTNQNVQSLQHALGQTAFNNLSRINSERVPKEDVVALTQKLLSAFNERYQEGSISYANGKLTVEGIVHSEADKDTLSALLASSTIDSQNNTRVVAPTPMVEELSAVKAQKEAKASEEKEQLAKKAQLEEKAKLEAEKEALEKAKQEAEALEAKEKEMAAAKTKQEAEEKAAQEKEKAEREKLEAEAKAAEEQAKLEEAKALEAKIKMIIDTKLINFEVNKDVLTAQSIETVKNIAEILKKHPTLNVEISGHTDNTGNANYNFTLSQKRVDSVKAKLIELQIDNNRLKAVGYGANQPLVSNDTKENRRINRRVEFKVIGE